MRNNNLSYWIFLVPSLLALFIVIFIPIIIGSVYSFADYDGVNIKGFVGLQNYINLFSDSAFLHSLWFTFAVSAVSVILINIIGLSFALIVTNKLGRINTIFRTIFFMSNLIGGIILGFIWQFIFLKTFSSLEEITGLGLFSGWLSTTATGFWGLVILFTWQMSGYVMVIYISFLNNIPNELLEAASIDGASLWKRFWKIKFPMLTPAFTVSVFLTLANAFKIYDQNLSLTGGGPFRTTEMATMNIFDTAFTAQKMGYGQAKAIIFLICITIISLVQLYFTRKREIDL